MKRLVIKMNKKAIIISGALAHADYIHHNALYVGNHPELTEEQIINLCKKLNNDEP